MSFVKKIFRKYKHLTWKISSYANYVAVVLPFGHLKPVRRMSRGGGGGEFYLRDSKIGSNGQKLFLVHDKVIAPTVNRLGCYDPNLINYIVKQLEGNRGPQLFIDIGANQGLVTLQVQNLLKNKSKLEYICVEPVKKYFDFLSKNIEIARNKNPISLINCGLGTESNIDAVAYSSKRNATSTQVLQSSFDNFSKLSQVKIEILSTSEFIQTNVDSKKFQNIVIKSDTDGSDVPIFINFMNSVIAKKISCYILELVFINLSKKDRKLLQIEFNKFSSWLLIDRKGIGITDKKIIRQKVLTENGFLGDIYLHGKFKTHI